MNHRVEVIIEAGHQYSDGSAEFTSVGFNAQAGYGFACPCDSDAEIDDAVAHSKAWILREGDIPVVNDRRVQQVALDKFF